MADIFETIGDWLGLNKGKATEKAAGQNKALIDQLAPVGRDIVGGIQDVTGDYLGTAKTGFGAYLDALGLNGQAGNDAALDRFQTGPGYQFGLDQGLDALQRRASSQGRLQSGATDIDLLQYGVKSANDEWGGWLDRLDDFGNMYGDAVGRDTAGRGLGLDFETGLSSAYMGANNQRAAGKEAGQGAMLDALGTIVGIGGKAFGAGSAAPAAPKAPAFGGYGSF